MPVLLTENFFFTNRSDLEKYLLDPGNREKIMDVHAKAVCHYFGVKYPRKKEKPKKKPEKVEPKEEEIEMLKEAIVINGYADFPAAEGLANRLDCPMYTKASIRGEVAEHLLLIGISDKSDYKADKITVLAGDDRYDTAENVKEYIDKL